MKRVYVRYKNEKKFLCKKIIHNPEVYKYIYIYMNM